MSKSDWQNSSQKQKELVELKKVEQGMIENIYEKEKENEKPLKMDKNQKRENFWFYNKTKIIALSVVLVIVGSLFTLYFTRPVYDNSLIFSATFSYDWYQEKIENVFSKFSKDYSGDNRIMVNVPIITILPKDNPRSLNEYSIANKSALLGSLITSEIYLFMLDDTSYEHITTASGSDKDIFLDLSKINPSIKGDKYYIKDTNFYKLFDMPKGDELPSDLFFCIRDPEKIADTAKREKFKDNFEHAKEMLNEIINYK